MKVAAFALRPVLPKLLINRYIPNNFPNGDTTLQKIHYLLDIPNGEVRSALVEQLMPMYMGISESAFVQRYWELKKYLYSGEVNIILSLSEQGGGRWGGEQGRGQRLSTQSKLSSNIR